MKKEVVLTIRVDAETDRAIRAIAEEDERTVAWVARKLITEALEERGALKKDKVSRSRSK
jgi:predicted transcriptional regulator